LFLMKLDTTPPTSVISAPLNGATLSGTGYTITGIVTDADGLGVKSVEVGFTPNGGATTWYPATGTASWSYDWTLPADGSYTIISRATDKGGNIEIPGTGVTVTVSKTPPAGSRRLVIALNPVIGGAVSVDPENAEGLYTTGTKVTLTAVPADGYEFVKWTGALTGKANPATVTMTTDKSITAVFRQVGFTLSMAEQDGVSVSLSASVYINGNPAKGKTVNFYEVTGTAAAVLKGTATVDANGVAAKTITSSPGTHTAYAVLALSSTDPFYVSPTGIVGQTTLGPKSNTVPYTISRVTLSSPGEVVTTRKASLTWQAYPDALYYRVQIATASSFGTTLFFEEDTDDPATLSMSSTSLILGKPYYWRVMAVIPTGNTMYSETRKVTYKTATTLTLEYMGKTGSTVTVRATLRRTDNNLAIPGRTVTFYENTTSGAQNVSKGTAVTGGTTTVAPGVASKSWATAAGAHHAYVKFIGDATFAPSETDPAAVSY